MRKHTGTILLPHCNNINFHLVKLFSFILHLSILMTNFTNILIFIAHPTESFKSKQEDNPRKKET